MTVHAENESGRTFDFDAGALIRKVVEAALDYEECPYEAAVEVVLTDDASIREVNAAARGIDAATDVLSFPTAFYETPADFDGLEAQDDCFDPETGEYLLGDIMISVDRVFAQAEAYGHSRARELAFLTAHSMLHLMGYDHMEEADARLMEQKQEAILEQVGITRDTEDGEAL